MGPDPIPPAQVRQSSTHRYGQVTVKDFDIELLVLGLRAITTPDTLHSAAIVRRWLDRHSDG
jgi:hypothetical protein